MREIIFDVETTGLEARKGDRIAEIACVELVNHLPTGKTWYSLVNPDRPMPAEATRIHGLTDEKLANAPRFHEICTDLMTFIGEANLVAHNGVFDLEFLNMELQLCKRFALPAERMVDTLVLARGRFPNSPNSLDALCRRFSVDLSGRELHGALIDCHLLASVYLELVGGRQPGLELAAEGYTGGRKRRTARPRTYREPRLHLPMADELERHAAFLEQIKDPIWQRADEAVVQAAE